MIYVLGDETRLIGDNRQSRLFTKTVKKRDISRGERERCLSINKKKKKNRQQRKIKRTELSHYIMSLYRCNAYLLLLRLGVRRAVGISRFPKKKRRKEKAPRSDVGWRRRRFVLYSPPCRPSTRTRV